MKTCPCGSNKLYIHCCDIFINGNALPSTPEQLMRSRYTAYTKANIDYIEQTMRGKAAQHFDKQEARKWAKRVTWLGLQVIQTKIELPHGWVEFVASYIERNARQSMHELSEFLLESGKWYYINGTSL